MEQQSSSSNNAAMSMEEKNQKTLGDYVGDMVALESHIEEALDRQLTSVQNDQVALDAVTAFHQVTKRQRDAMKSLKDSMGGGTAGNPVKEVGSSILGKAAGLIDKVRTEGNSKALRDDYTAFNLAAVGYTMLYTTATGLGNQQIADIAERHLTAYARAIQKINHIIAEVVVNELRNDDHVVQSDAADRTRAMVDTAWKAGDDTSSSYSSSALAG